MPTATTLLPTLLRFLPTLFCLLLLSGCGSDRPQTIPVEGTVTLNGGPWPAPGELYFLPTRPAEGFPRRPGTAEFGTDGEFAATTWEDGDGLTPGKYKVFVMCWKTPPTFKGPPPESYVDVKYQAGATSDITLEVKLDSAPDAVTWNFTGPKR
jgi:hypothetical protein